jgi:hypothetical protein
MNSSDHLATIATFRSPVDAQVAKGLLDEAGIASMIRSDNAGGMYPAVGAAALLVRAEDSEKAWELLKETITDRGVLDEAEEPLTDG